MNKAISTANLKDLIAPNLTAMPNLEVGKTYIYYGTGSPFDKTFTFLVKEDNFDSYFIEIMGGTHYNLPKDFDLLEAYQSKRIELYEGEQYYDEA